MAQGFDPVAATAAYLAQLPPALHDKAKAYTQGGHWLLLWGTLVAILVAWIVLRTGVLVRVRSAVERGKPRLWLAVAAVVVVDGVIELVLSLPWDAYAHWWRERLYGLTSRPFGGWLSEHLTANLIGIVPTIVLAAILYWLVRRAPRTWWLWGGVLAGVGSLVLSLLSPVLLEPIFNTYTPAPPGPVRDEVVAMAKQVGVPHDKILIYNGSKQSNRYTANVAGVGATARVAMSDVMFKKDADLAEVRGVVGHEMGHYVHGHIYWLALAYGLMALVSFLIVDRTFGLVLRWTGAKGVRGLADPAGLPVVSIILAVVTLIGTPVQNSVTRAVEADADRFSLTHFNEPDGLAKALVKTIEYRYDSPSRLEEIIFYDHPSVRARVLRCMQWKATHPKSAP
ncbi:MAG TPA: M48 family metalloprotease [Phenylobacterium sp.]|uniref:M48 family metalloprotease n=1 Tax=Phenylobacterium sp. TaxID=1871053 RepID=UPI002D1E2329|nr:M48 family metalloprotease [Phenylobacterium sp.]HSV03121.1 M48 family metalloprotease [Phenylobacterium sp.]